MQQNTYDTTSPAYRRWLLTAIMAAVAGLSACGGGGGSSSGGEAPDAGPGSGSGTEQTPTPPTTPVEPEPAPPTPAPEPGPGEEPGGDNEGPGGNEEPGSNPDDGATAPTDSSTAGACHNPARFKEGSSYTAVMKTSGIAGVTGDITSTIKVTMLGRTTFNGHSTLDEYAEDGTGSGNHNYYDFVGGTMYTYGAQDDGVKETLSPAHQFPINMEQGKTYTSTSTVMPDGMQPYTQTVQETFQGFETVTVPAGTFKTCKVAVVTTTPVGNVAAWVWAAADGPYHGLMVKNEVEMPAIAGMSFPNTVTEAVSLEANFK